ncbi:MAG: Xaa-pro aminopeptidase [uncultured archaeon A07HN63]|nr:MAG: Xaa-pro aminopeptidase [uncultured archaeon A07HN63]
MGVLADVLSQPETAGFVHVARSDDPVRRYLTRDPEPRQPAALVCLPADTVSQGDNPVEAIYSVPNAHRDTAAAAFVASEDPADENDSGSDEINRTVATREPETPPGTHVVRLLADQLGDAAGTGTLRVPSHIPHDAAVRLQRAGYDISSTAAVTEARASKTSAERECLRAVQQAGAHGIAHATDRLAAATTDDGRLHVDGEPLSATQLERDIATAVAETGVTPETVAVRAPATNPSGPLPAGEGIVIAVRPRGPHGYYGHLTRTVAVDSDGGWDRRAHIAAKAGLTTARTHCQPGTSVATVAAEVRAELTAYGFPPRTELAKVGATTRRPTPARRQLFMASDSHQSRLPVRARTSHLNRERRSLSPFALPIPTTADSDSARSSKSPTTAGNSSSIIPSR